MGILKITIPEGDAKTLASFLIGTAQEFIRKQALETTGIILRYANFDICLGRYSSDLFSNYAIVDELCLHFAPITYEAAQFLIPGKTYRDINFIRADTVLCRVIYHSPNQNKNSSTPLYALNTVPITFDGLWRDLSGIDSLLVSPTFEMVNITPGQRITFRGISQAIDELDLRSIQIYELSRLASLSEYMVGEAKLDHCSPGPLIEQLTHIIETYQQNREPFAEIIIMGHALFALGQWLLFTACNIDLLFGHLRLDHTDRYIASAGGVIAKHAIQRLSIHSMRTQSDAYKTFGKVYETHDYAVFMMDWQEIGEKQLTRISRLFEHARMGYSNGS